MIILIALNDNDDDHHHHLCCLLHFSLACVADVERERGKLGARESVWGGPHALSRAQIPPSPSPFNAGHAG